MMKKLILSLVTLIFAASAAAQESGNTAGVSQWLTEFSEININGPFQITFEQVPETEAPRIVYDTKGSYTSKFRAEVKNNILFVSERAESRRETVTEVRVCFHKLGKIRITGATATFAQPLTGTTIDAVIGGGAVVTAGFGIMDLQIEATGKSRVILSGEARYLTLTASAAKVDAAQMEVMSAVADATNGAEVSLRVTERLEARTATNARITYAGDPAIVRGGRSFTGGEIVKAD